MDVEDYQLISANAERFAVANLTPVLGQAPDAWSELPDPDAIFIGGTGRNVRRIVEQAYARLRTGGRIVVNVVSMENLTDVQQLMCQLAGEANVWMINIARGTQQFETHRFESMHPTFLVAALKP
jgi:precorrin-6Y C5,15-methyltransferase (decarboxylating)